MMRTPPASAAALARLQRTNGTGFSMLEVVIALAVAAVLTAYAIPSYRAYCARGHRIDAVMALHRAAQHIAADASPLRTAPRLPPGLDRVPERGRAVYRLEVSANGEASGGYALKAIPEADGPMRGDACGVFVLDALGFRSNLGAAMGGASVERCWAGRAI
ncbi:type IV pilin protein [Trinickia diaoshuihuensis]|uniref:type IV pilin protein n=1 Tax=Trinickia diaoshuihuensis TaxID=2292265 RepID=UPI001F07BA49|nr:type IV pilin protein [Trinickia diaoshuihuensis]